MNAYETLKTQLQSKQYTWLITGAAGFIGSNLLEVLLKLNQKVVSLDNFSTGHQRNRASWFIGLFDDFKLLFRGPAPAALNTGDHFHPVRSY